MLWGARDLLLATPRWLDYLRAVYATDPAGYPFLTYVGLNFTRDAIKNFKFYFSFFRRLSAEEIARLLPVPDRGRFAEVYEDWQPTKQYDTIHRGTTFAVKVEPDGALTHYYHLRIPGLPFGRPERLALKPEDEGNYHGVCEEFGEAASSLKRYYYCRHPETIAESLEIAGLGDLVDQVPAIEWLEYIESEERDKLTWITSSPPILDALIYQRGPERLGPGISKIRYDCGFELFGPGSARDGGDHSVYFVLHEGPLSAGGFLFDGVQRFLTHHLGIDL